jgi:tellurite resistance protein
MLKNFNHEEKKALVAIVKFIIAADGEISETELAKTVDLAGRKGMEDFQEIFLEVEKEVKSMDDLKKLIHTVRKRTHEQDILKIAVDFALADVSVDPAEVEVLRLMGEEWGINVSKLLTALD